MMNETAPEVKRGGEYSCRGEWMRPGPGEAPDTPGPPARGRLPACLGAPEATQPLAFAFPPPEFPVSPLRFFFSQDR